MVLLLPQFSASSLASGRSYSSSETTVPTSRHSPSDNARMDNSASPRLSGGLLPGGGRFSNTVDPFNEEMLLAAGCAACQLSATFKRELITSTRRRPTFNGWACSQVSASLRP